MLLRSIITEFITASPGNTNISSTIGRDGKIQIRAVVSPKFSSDGVCRTIINVRFSNPNFRYNRCCADNRKILSEDFCISVSTIRAEATSSKVLFVHSHPLLSDDLKVCFSSIAFNSTAKVHFAIVKYFLWAKSSTNVPFCSLQVVQFWNCRYFLSRFPLSSDKLRLHRRLNPFPLKK